MTLPDARAALADLERRLAPSDPLGAEELDALAGVIAEVRDFPGGTTLTRAKVAVEASQLLVSGFVCRQTSLPDGRRHVLAIHVPGDFIDLHSMTLRSLDHDVVTLAPVRIAFVPHDALREVVARFPHLGRMLWFITTVDAAIHRQWIASLGCLAVERVAHLLCELQMRLAVIGQATDTGFLLPITQIDIANAVALTPVHVNRTLRHLREEGLVDARGGRIAIGDLKRLQRIARFDPDYLYLDNRPR